MGIISFIFQDTHPLPRTVTVSRTAGSTKLNVDGSGVSPLPLPMMKKLCPCYDEEKKKNINTML
jgi:hypothetical protein